MGSVRRTAETFKIEEAYEFCAPQFVDFTTTNTRVIDNLPDHFVDFGKNDVDDWFGKRLSIFQVFIHPRHLSFI